MSFKTNALDVSEPIFYHREFTNDIGEPSDENSWLDVCKRTGTVALPFVSLYKPLSLPLSLAMGGLRTLNSISCLATAIQESGAGEIGYALLQTTISVTALAGTIFAHPLGMLVTTGHDLIIELTQLAQNLYVGEYQKALENCLSIVNNVLYLVLFLDGGLEFAIASLAMQILVGIYHSFSEFQQGNYLEGAGHAVMAIFRTDQLAGQVNALQLKREIENSIKTPGAENNSSKTAASVGQSPPKKVAEKAAFSQMLSEAKEANNQELIDILIKYGNNPQGLPVLHYAISQNDLRAVQVLAENGANLNLKSSLGYTPIHQSIFVKNARILEYLSSKGAILDPLSVTLAARGNFLPGLNLLLERGAPIPSKELLHVILIDQTVTHKVEIAKTLIRHGADCKYLYHESFPVDRHNPNGPQVTIELSLLTLAVPLRDLELVQLLVERGAPINCAMNDALSKFDPNNPKNEAMKIHEIHRNPLYLSALHGCQDISAYLLSKGAIVTSVHQQHFHLLLTRGLFQKDRVKLLLNLNLLSSHQMQSLFDAAVSMPWAPHVKKDNQMFAVQEFFERGAIVRDEHLQQAVKYGNKDLIEWLLAHGAKP